MMKKIIITCAIMSLATIANSSNINDLNISGSAKIANQQYKSINISGQFEADKVTASDSTKISGNASFKNSQFHSLIVSGNAFLYNSKVDGEINISGKLTLENSDLKGNNLNCSGTIKSINSTYELPINISGELVSFKDKFNDIISFSGKIEADNSTFNKTITTSSIKSIWKNSVIHADIINESKSLFMTPTIVLENTIVMGKIKFTKNKGLVILKNKSIVNGSIENADIK